jgi:23S rRNA (uracil1939-C5)-methyltransferase
MKLPTCTHRPPCPGCPRYGEKGLGDECSRLLADLAARSGARLDPVVEGPATAFRLRARLAVRGRARSPKIGIFQEGSHAIVDIPSCPIHSPRINQTVRALREAVRRSGVAPYADRPHVGLLRYVQVVVERGSDAVQVVLVANDVSVESMLPLAEELVPALGERLQGLWWNGNPERTNTIFGEDWLLLAGREAVEETIGGARVFFPPGAFGQSNLDLADRLVDEVHARVPEDAVVAEFYCGVGAIGLGLVARAREVRFNEVSPHGLAGLAMGIAALPPGLRERATVCGGAAGTAAAMLDGATCVIVDPPRKGLDDALVTRLRRDKPGRLLYVSCDPESLTPDADRLAANGLWRLTRLTPYALFPHTDHVETLAQFD